MPVGPREVKLIRHCYARHNEGDDTAWLEVFDEDMEMSVEGLSFFEDGTWRGRDEVAKQFVNYFGAFSEFRFFVHELAHVGDWVFADVTHRGRGRSSGIELAVRSFAVYRFQDGKVVDFAVLRSRRDADALMRR